MPTPEQWDLVAKFKSRRADKEHNSLSADLSFPTYGVGYSLAVAAEPGGVRVSVSLDKPLPEKLVGRAGFETDSIDGSHSTQRAAATGVAIYQVVLCSAAKPWKSREW